MSTEVTTELIDAPIFGDRERWELSQRKATAYSKSTMVPKEYQNNLPNCIVALEMADRMNASILQVMQNLDVIHGRPSWRAQFLIATFNACGRFSPIRYKFTGERARITGVASHGPSNTLLAKCWRVLRLR